MTRLFLFAALPLAAQFGQFQNAIRAEFLPDGRFIQLLEDLVYDDDKGQRWIAPKGSKVDGASIPPALWSVIGGPYEGKYREASVIHDVECQRKSAPWKDVHYRFYTAMRARGVAEKLALGMYGGVKVCGPQWRPDGTNIPPPFCPETYFKLLLSLANGDTVLESRSRAAKRATQTAQAARADAEKWSAELAAAEKAERQSSEFLIAAMPPPPPNENAAQRNARVRLEAMVVTERKARAEQIGAHKAAASAAAAKANEALREAEAEVANPTRRPLPPLTVESIQNLTFEDIEP